MKHVYHIINQPVSGANLTRSERYFRLWSRLDLVAPRNRNQTFHVPSA